MKQNIMNHPALRRLLWILLAAPYFKPAILGVLAGTDLIENMYNAWRLLSAALVCLGYLLCLLRRRLRPSKVMLFLWAYMFFVLLSTVLNAHNYWFAANYTVTIVSFCMLIELSLLDGPEAMLDMLFYPLTVLMLTNLILLIIYPGGITYGGTFGYTYNFLGIDNYLGPLLIPYMVLVVLRSEIYLGEVDLTAWLLTGCAALSLLLVWSTTAILGLGVMLLFLLVFYRRRWETLFNPTTSMLAGFGLFFGIVLFRLQNLFAFFIEGVLHKGLSFTGRTDIWDQAITDIMKQPVLGYGIAQYGKVYRLRRGKYYHAHNALLETAMEGGICAFICYLMMLASAAGPLLEYRKHPFSCLVSAGLMSCAVMTSMESYLDSNGLLIYCLLLVGCHIAEFIRCADAHAAAEAECSIEP